MYMEEIDLSQITGFDWDEGNQEKNWISHKVNYSECEEVFFDEPQYFPDKKHSSDETRYVVFGKSYSNRSLTVIFTIRGDKIRVISARDQSKKDERIYSKFITSLQPTYEKK